MIAPMPRNQPSAPRIQNQWGGPGLTQDERLTLAEILYPYDAANLTAADARAIRKELSRAGIWPSRAVEKTLKNAGYNLTRPKEKNPGRAPAQSRIDRRIAEALAPLQAIVSHYDLANLSRADEISLYNRMREAGLWK